MKYFIEFNTGAGNEIVEGTLEEAKKAAEDGLAYTQRDVVIYDEDENEVTRLPWYGVKPTEDDFVTAQYGDFGFYGEWTR